MVTMTLFARVFGHSQGKHFVIIFKRGVITNSRYTHHVTIGHMHGSSFLRTPAYFVHVFGTLLNRQQVTPPLRSVVTVWGHLSVSCRVCFVTR